MDKNQFFENFLKDKKTHFWQFQNLAPKKLKTAKNGIFWTDFKN